MEVWTCVSRARTDFSPNSIGLQLTAWRWLSRNTSSQWISCFEDFLNFSLSHLEIRMTISSLSSSSWEWPKEWTFKNTFLFKKNKSFWLYATYVNITLPHPLHLHKSVWDSIPTYSKNSLRSSWLPEWIWPPSYVGLTQEKAALLTGLLESFVGRWRAAQINSRVSLDYLNHWCFKKNLESD